MEGHPNMCHGFCCCATPPSCLPSWKVQKFFCVWISGNSDKLPQGLIICPDWSPPKPKEDAAVAQFLFCPHPLFCLSFLLFDMLPSSNPLFFSCVCRACASLVSNFCYPISKWAEPALCFSFFHQKGSKIPVKLAKKKLIKFILLCFAISKCQSHALARLVSTLHQDQIWDLRAHCCAQPWQRDYNSHGKDNTAE